MLMLLRVVMNFKHRLKIQKHELLLANFKLSQKSNSIVDKRLADSIF